MIVGAFATTLAVVVFLPSLALALLAIASLRRPRRLPPAATEPDLAVLIAAHDEERTIGGTLEAIHALEPALRVHVVADNCADRTAERAAAAGACVHRRIDPRRTGKAAALNDLIVAVFREDPAAAFAFLDADSRPEPGFFAGLREAMARGADAAQAKNLVAPARAPLSRLRQLAFHLKCELRPLAYDALGVSVGLHGNGMCLSRALLRSYMWDDGSVVEDGDLHLQLVRDGVRVMLAHDATVRSPMPTRFDGAAGQAVRWERGKFDLLAPALGLLRLALAERRLDALVAAVDVLIPPLTVLLAAAVAVGLFGAIVGAATATSLAGVALLCCAIYVARGLSLSRVDAAGLVEMVAWAAPYVVWKVVIVARTVLGAGRGQWTQARAQVKEVNG